MQVTDVTSLIIPGLEPYRTMRRTMEHRRQGIFVAEGEKVVRRLLQSNLRVVSLLLTNEWFENYRESLERKEIEQTVFVAEKKLLEEIVGYGLHQGIMAIGRVPQPIDIRQLLPTLENPRLLVTVDGIANSENMGVIVRNCAAFGVDALIVGETSCDPYLRRSVRNSMGTVFGLNVVSAPSLPATLRELHGANLFQIVAADPKNDSIPATEGRFDGDTCLVFGSEGEGISENVLRECSIRVKIPMQNQVDSINVASSVGVLLYECRRQRLNRKV